MAEKSISALSPDFFPHFTETDSSGHFCVPLSCCKSSGKESHLEDFAPSQLHTVSGAYLALLHLQASPRFPWGCAALLPPLLSLSAKKRNIPGQIPEGKQRSPSLGMSLGCPVQLTSSSASTFDFGSSCTPMPSSLLADLTPSSAP